MWQRSVKALLQPISLAYYVGPDVDFLDRAYIAPNK